MPDSRPSGARTAFTANARHDGHTCVQIGGGCHFRTGQFNAGQYGWALGEVSLEPPNMPMRVEADVEVEIPSATHREDADYDESDGRTWGTEIRLTLCAEPYEVFDEVAGFSNFVEVEEWPRVLCLLPWQ